MSWHVPGYVHRRELGNGTTGRVVLAVQEETGDLVVIKYLKVNFEDLDRVREDVALISTLDNAYFGHIREYVEDLDAGRAAIVMDAVNGVSLRLLLRDHGALAPEAALVLFRDSLLGLGAAHDIDIAHGDYRPENVLIDAEGACLLLDVAAVTWTDRDVTLSTGVYRSPERWHRDSITASADIYAASITFVEMYVGEPPYWEASQLLALRYMHEQDEIPVEAFPISLRDIVRLGLAKDAEMRADATTLLELIEIVAVDEFGADWEGRGRSLIGERIALLALPLGGDLVVDEEIVESDAELVELDDYYADETLVAGAIGVAAVADDASAGGDFGDEELVAEDVEIEDVEIDEVEIDEVAIGVSEVDVSEVDVTEVEVAEVEVAEADITEVDVTEIDVAGIAAEEVLVDDVVTGGAVVGDALTEEIDVEEVDVEEVDLEEVETDETDVEAVDETDVLLVAGAVGVSGAADEFEISEADAAGVVAAAEDIVVLARIEEVAAATAMANAAVEEELTEEEELAVAEVEQLVVAQEAAAEAEAVEAAAAAQAAEEVAAEEVAAEEAAAVEAAEIAAAVVAAEESAAFEAAEVAAAEETAAEEEAAAAAIVEAEELAATQATEAAVIEEAAMTAAAIEAARLEAARIAAGRAEAARVAGAETAVFDRITGEEVGEEAELVAASAGIPSEEIPTAQIPRIRESSGSAPVLVGAGIGAAAVAGGGGGRRRGGGGGGIVGGGGGNETTSFVRRHPWAMALFGIIFILLCGGAALAFTSGPAGGPATPVAAGSSTHQTGLTTVVSQTTPAGPTTPAGASTIPAGGQSVPAGSQSVPGGGQTVPGGGQTTPAGGRQTTPAGGQSTPATSRPSAPATTPATTRPPAATPQPAPAPTLPVTGIHPIRQMLVIAWTLFACGAWLMFVFRRRRIRIKA